MLTLLFALGFLTGILTLGLLLHLQHKAPPALQPVTIIFPEEKKPQEQASIHVPDDMKTEASAMFKTPEETAWLVEDDDSSI